MRLEWLEDLQAVIDAGSFNAAAKRRGLTQPAFSRRMKTIEEYVGVELFDRSHKPVQLQQAVLDQQVRILELSNGLRSLLHELRRDDRDVRNRIVVAGQHATSAARAPELVKRLPSSMDVVITLRLAERDECHAMLLTRQADFALTYEYEGEPLLPSMEFLERSELGSERFVPVCAASIETSVRTAYAANRISLIAYPPDAFLGRVVKRLLLPQLPAELTISNRVESALSLAVAQCATTGLGVAWVPASVITAELDAGTLVELGDILPVTALRVIGTRLSGGRSALEQRTWELLCDVTSAFTE